MSPDDEAELHRLCRLLRDLDHHADTTPDQRVALQKAALALHHAFTTGRRQTLESLSPGAPLTAAQHEALRRRGLDPGHPGETG